MKNIWTKLSTAAAAIILIFLAGFLFSERATTPAYAMEQTVTASHSVRFIHIKMRDLTTPGGPEDSEIWTEFAATGQLSRGRIETRKSVDGPKSAVLHDRKVEVWLPAKRMHAIFSDENSEESQGLIKLMEEADPKNAVDRLVRLQNEGKADVDIRPSADPTKPICITATGRPGTPVAGKRMVLTVDPATKLVSRVEILLPKGKDHVPAFTFDYLEYNQPIAEKTFVLDVPPDAMVIDQTRQLVGLAQGTLSDDEIAVRVVREYFEAWKAKDFGKMGQLMEGLSADFMQKNYGPMTMVRIISIGKPIHHAQTRALRVPVVVEIEKDGKRAAWSPFGPFVRKVHGQAGRWDIIGGI